MIWALRSSKLRQQPCHCHRSMHPPLATDLNVHPEYNMTFHPLSEFDQSIWKSTYRGSGHCGPAWLRTMSCCRYPSSNRKLHTLITKEEAGMQQVGLWEQSLTCANFTGLPGSSSGGGDMLGGRGRCRFGGGGPGGGRARIRGTLGALCCSAHFGRCTSPRLSRRWARTRSLAFNLTLAMKSLRVTTRYHCVLCPGDNVIFVVFGQVMCVNK